MRIFKKIILLFIITGLFNSCFSDYDDEGNSNLNDFVWKGLNFVYLYKDFKPDLANDRFSTNSDYNEYLRSFSSPQELFDNLIYSPTDEFSWLETDYIALEQLLSGTTISHGMEFDIRLVPGSNTNAFGIVRYVLPNSNADVQGVKRGDVFIGINGNPLTANNYLDVYYSDSYTINLATYDNNGTPETNDDIITSTSESIALSKSPFTENPVFKTEVIDVEGDNVGYLMYNAFTSDFDAQLNNAFGTFLSSNITELVLDLRYNSGGSVRSAIALSSMITGQFNNQVFLTEQWNSEWQEYLETEEPDLLVNNFTDELSTGEAINSLNLDKVYILTSKTSASASELVINCLNPYIEVIQIGTATRGKYQASVTLYDSGPPFSREGANPYHTYALQPLIYKTLNSEGFTDYSEGLIPEMSNILAEDFGNFGVLGDVNEPLLAAALAHISGASRFGFAIEIEELTQLGDSKKLSPIKNRMYSDKPLPIRN